MLSIVLQTLPLRASGRSSCRRPLRTATILPRGRHCCTSDVPMLQRCSYLLLLSCALLTVAGKTTPPGAWPFYGKSPRSARCAVHLIRFKAAFNTFATAQCTAQTFSTTVWTEQPSRLKHRDRLDEWLVTRSNLKCTAAQDSTARTCHNACHSAEHAATRQERDTTAVSAGHHASRTRAHASSVADHRRQLCTASAEQPRTCPSPAGHARPAYSRSSQRTAAWNSSRIQHDDPPPVLQARHDIYRLPAGKVENHGHAKNCTSEHG